MPNKKSSLKRVRQNDRRRIHNRSKRSAMRTSVKSVRLAVENNDTESLDQKLKTAQSKLGKAAKTNLIKKGNASRQVSRLSKLVNKAKSAEA